MHTCDLLLRVPMNLIVNFNITSKPTARLSILPIIGATVVVYLSILLVLLFFPGMIFQTNTISNVNLIRALGICSICCIGGIVVCGVFWVISSTTRAFIGNILCVVPYRRMSIIFIIRRAILGIVLRR